METSTEYHGLDTADRVCFYEQDFYVLSNFSSFNVNIWGKRFQTSEHAYHWRKFCDTEPSIADAILHASSAHNAFKIAQHYQGAVRKDWNDVKVGVMKEILEAKVQQHDYVKRKLLATGDRELVENSWRDTYWGWGPKRDGKNMLGKVWMDIRTTLQKQEDEQKAERAKEAV